MVCLPSLHKRDRKMCFAYMHACTYTLHVYIYIYRSLPPTTVAVKESEERLAKFFVHEAIRDGIATAGDVSQQLDQADASTTDHRVHEIGRKEVPRIDHVQRCPAYEELQHNHEEHSDHLQHHSSGPSARST